MNKRSIYVVKDNGSGFSFEVEHWGDTFEWVQDGYTVSLRDLETRQTQRQGPPHISYRIYLDGVYSGYAVGQEEGQNRWVAVSGHNPIARRECLNETVAGWGQVGAAAKLLFAVNGSETMS